MNIKSKLKKRKFEYFASSIHHSSFSLVHFSFIKYISVIIYEECVGRKGKIKTKKTKKTWKTFFYTQYEYVFFI